VQELTPELAESFKLGNIKGVLITETIRNSPAEKAGVRRGDILIAIDDQPIESWSAMLETVANLPPGKDVLVKLMRDGEAVNLKLKIGKRPKPRTQ
jgi:serine protease DegQ